MDYYNHAELDSSRYYQRLTFYKNELSSEKLDHHIPLIDYNSLHKRVEIELLSLN